MAHSRTEEKTAAEIVAALDLQRHPDGGFYLETFRDPSISLPNSALPAYYKVDRAICRDSIPGLQVDHVDISELPLLNTDLKVDGGFPPAVEEFHEKVHAADCFLFASPEYNYSISGPLKNALDWGSRPPNCWADRAAAILSASGRSGGTRLQYHIRQVGVFLDIHFINKPEVFTYAHHPPNKFNDDGNLVDPETKEKLSKMLLSLQAFAQRLKGEPANSQQGD